MNCSKKSSAAFTLCLMCAAIFASVYAQYQLPAIAGSIIEAFGLSPTQFSSIFSAPMIPTIAFSIIGGILVDKVGVKPVVATCAGITALGVALRIFSRNYALLMFAMILAGFLPTILNGNSGKIFALYYPPEKLSSVIGAFCACSTCAMAIGTATTAMLPGIKTVFTLSTVLMLIVTAALVFLWKVPAPDRREDRSHDELSVFACIKAVLGNRHIWLIGLVLGMNMAAVMVLNTFLPTALASRGLSDVTAGVYSSIVMVGNAVAAVIVPLVAIKTKKAKQVISLSTLIGAIGVCFAWKCPVGIPLGAALFVSGVAMSGLMPLLMSLPVQLSGIGPAFAGTAGGVVVTLQMLCAVIIPSYVLTPVFGDNLSLLFIAGGALLIIGFVISFMLPNLDKA